MSTVSSFKTSINKIRDILRRSNNGITGMDSMRTICLYLVARYLSVERANEVGIPSEYSWEEIVRVSQTMTAQVAMDRFYHPNDECLITHLDRIFGTDKFTFDVKDVRSHIDIIEVVDKIDILELDRQIDILGYVYEQHLATGGKNRDLGQYFTERNVCDYMVDLCQPTVKSNNVPETVLDPSMGTGGFLISYLKYLKKYNIDWSIHNHRIQGCDVDQKLVAITKMNLFMETGGNIFNAVCKQDSLQNDVPSIGYDIILANMPFGLKGIKYADCCDKIKELKINGTNSEPLFLQLMMTSLNEGGRCAVVIPDGVLVNKTKIHNNTRKYLLENFELNKIIKMKGNFFMNTGIKPSILFFQRSGNKTNDIEFIEVEKDSRGNIVENVIGIVNINKIDKNYSLDFKKYQEKEEERRIPADVSMVKLETIVDMKNGKVLSSVDKEIGGQYKVMGGGMDYNGFYSNYNRDGETISVSKSGASSGFVKYHNDKYWAGDCFTLTTNDNCNIRYLYYVLKNMEPRFMSISKNGMIDHCTFDTIKDFEIPLPSIEIQQQIVSTLETFNIKDVINLSSICPNIFDIILNDISFIQYKQLMSMIYTKHSIQQSIENLKSSASAIIAGTKDFPKKKLGDISEIQKGDRITKEIDGRDEGYHVYGGGDATFYTDKFNRYGKTCKIGRDGVSCHNIVQIINGKYWLNSSGVTIVSNSEKVINEYIWHVLSMNKSQLYEMSRGSGQRNMDMDALKDFEIPLPPLRIQTSIVQRIDKIQASIDQLQSSLNDIDDNIKFTMEMILMPKDNLEALSTPPTDNSRISSTSVASSRSTSSYDKVKKDDLIKICKEKGIKTTTKMKVDDIRTLLNDYETSMVTEKAKLSDRIINKYAETSMEELKQ
jgi:type I restriction-modification system DNA methylase subunit